MIELNTVVFEQNKNDWTEVVIIIIFTGESSGNSGKIAGSIIGVLVIAGVIVGLVIFYRKKNLDKSKPIDKTENMVDNTNIVTYKSKGTDDSIQVA